MLLGWERAPDEPSARDVLELTEPPRGGDFTLMSADGPMSLDDFRGKVVLIYFGYTWCPDICPLNLSYLRMALDSLTPEERERVQVLFVSVDPERDTPQRLREYTEHFAPEILGVTGTPQQVAETAALYGAAYRRVETGDSAMGYSVDHSAYTYLLDTSGRLRQSLEHATPPERIVSAIRLHLKEGERP
ncbi:MAG: SCO family protein [Chromatiaceae bacterium]|nr:SCO family protein [Chromatiaceae bacterium]